MTVKSLNVDAPRPLPVSDAFSQFQQFFRLILLWQGNNSNWLISKNTLGTKYTFMSFTRVPGRKTKQSGGVRVSILHHCSLNTQNTSVSRFCQLRKTKTKVIWISLLISQLPFLLPLSREHFQCHRIQVRIDRGPSHPLLLVSSFSFSSPFSYLLLGLVDLHTWKWSCLLGGASRVFGQCLGIV